MLRPSPAYNLALDFSQLFLKILNTCTCTVFTNPVSDIFDSCKDGLNPTLEILSGLYALYGDNLNASKVLILPIEFECGDDGPFGEAICYKYVTRILVWR